MLKKTGKPNRQVERTKSWILDAVMLLMDEKPYKKITVSEICKKVGIARPTFYNNFTNIDNVINEYLKPIINMELFYMKKNKKEDKQNKIVLIFDFKYMVKHQKNLKKIMSTVDIMNRIYREQYKKLTALTESYEEHLSTDEYVLCRYIICYRIIGSLIIIFDWLINNMPLPAEKLISMVNDINFPMTAQNRNIPVIYVKIKDN